MAHMLATVIAFKGEDDVSPSTPQLLEITEVTPSGKVEIAIDMPRSTRVYISFDLAELVRLSMIEERTGE